MVILFYQYSFIANYGDRVSPGELGRINEPETAWEHYSEKIGWYESSSWDAWILMHLDMIGRSHTHIGGGTPYDIMTLHKFSYHTKLCNWNREECSICGFSREKNHVFTKSLVMMARLLLMKF